MEKRTRGTKPFFLEREFRKSFLKLRIRCGFMIQMSIFKIKSSYKACSCAVQRKGSHGVCEMEEREKERKRRGTEMCSPKTTLTTLLRDLCHEVPDSSRLQLAEEQHVCMQMRVYG